MDRTLIAWNVPNLITIPLMAFVGFLIFGLLWQVVMNIAAPANAGNNAGGGGF